MYKDLTDFSLKQIEKLGVEYAEAKLEHNTSSSFLLKNGNPEISGINKVYGIGIRYIINGCLGFISINDFNKEKIEDLITKSVRLTKNAFKIGEKIELSEEPSHIKNYKVKQKLNLQDISPEKKFNNLIELDKEIKHIFGRFFSLGDTITKKYYINTEGTRISSEIPRVGFYYFITIKEGAKSIQRYLPFGGTGGWELLRKWNLNKVLQEDVNALTKNLKYGIKTPKGHTDLIISPEIVGIAVHESTGHPYEADRIFGREAAQAGESFITPKMINTKIGSEIVNVVDDPTVEGSNGFYLYDDEGVKARRKFLIKAGLINEFLHNRETAFEMKVKSNGSARANNYDKEAIVRMSNTFMLPGNYKEEEIIKETKNGIYMKSFTEWNIDDKRFQQKYVGAEAYLIKDGEITRPVKSPILEITTPAFYQAIDALSKKVEFVAGNCGKGEPMSPIPVWFGGPTARLKNVHIK